MEGPKADWRDRFLAPVVLDARVARTNPQRGYVVSDVGGRFQVFAWDRSKGAISAVTSSDAAVLTAAISPDGDWIYALEETVPGSEMGHIHRIPFEGGDSEDVTPRLDPYSSYGFRATPSGVVALAGMGGSQVLIVADGVEARSYELPGLIAGLAVSDDGAFAAVTVATPGRGLVPMLQLMDLASGRVIATGAEMSGGGVHDGRVAVGVVDGDWMRPGIWDGKTLTRIETDIPGSLVPVDWSQDGSLILLAQSYRAKGDLFLYGVSSGELDQVASPSGARPPSDSPSLLDSGHVLSIWSDNKTARHLVEADKEHWRPALEIDGQGPFEGPEWEEFSYSSAGGIEIQGWLLRPQGTGPWPTVLYTHGGPSSVHSPAFNPICAAWFDAGFAVASVNYRGSTTFGEEFRESLTKNIGGPDIEDVVAAHGWLVESGIAIPGQIIKNGYSYGGYLTLQSLGIHPDLWVAGVAGAPIADWAMSFEDSNDILREYQLSLFGGSPDELAENYRKASPRSYVASFKAPILISQPENDSRTPMRPVQVFVDEMGAAGKQVELRLMAGGHAGSGKSQTINMVESWLEFARPIVGLI